MGRGKEGRGKKKREEKEEKRTRIVTGGVFVLYVLRSFSIFPKPNPSRYISATPAHP